ncbi:rhamnogalacturonan lyase [Phyllosticta capitalensis]|uniref:Rhamnogalacturonate lyase n=1 Tax=Phyllosticta capitalensis TaxID=121624 RepID=A0ABR1YTD9_9PEZI
MGLSTPLLALFALWTPSALAAFGLTDSDGSYVISSGSGNGLTVTVEQSSCDITSIMYRSEEFQYASTGTQLSSGLGSATVTAEEIESTYVKVTCTTDTLTHYIIVKSGEDILYMGTNTQSEPSVGELRFIARLDPDKLPLEYPYGDVSTTSGGTAIEASDVYEVDGETRSKFYSGTRFIDDSIQCVYREDDAIHACVLLQPLSYECSSGGPFFKDINSNNAGSSTNLYFYMNSGHVQTEEFRQGFHGPYAMQFSRSGVPSADSLDFSFFGVLDIDGYVPESQRGYVSGTASGVTSGYDIVLHWYNDNFQYWAYASSSGAFTSPAMQAGEYTQVLYQQELKVATATVTVTAGATATASIESAFEFPDAIFTIGEWDGQPFEFRNGDKFERMHPSDDRMESWGPLTYTVGTSATTDVPMALFKGVNDPLTIVFTATSAQTGAATLRIGTTLSFAGGRPQATVNDYTGDAPSAPTKIDSRGVTRGGYRGYGEIYEVSIPEGTIVEGENTITISVISGSSGDTYLSPNVILDCIDLYLA